MEFFERKFQRPLYIGVIWHDPLIQFNSIQFKMKSRRVFHVSGKFNDV